MLTYITFHMRTREKNQENLSINDDTNSFKIEQIFAYAALFFAPNRFCMCSPVGVYHRDNKRDKNRYGFRSSVRFYEIIKTKADIDKKNRRSSSS